ncbi:MAG: carboxylesterase/lipase family protein [Myxococcota bacterium]|nr:carboxylesterase/lipase family protein [Myxococcota bacterium]
MRHASVETRSGMVRGAVEQDLVVLRGVPFGAASADARRFEPPAREEAWTGVREARVAGPAAPQRGSMVMRMLGLDDVAQDEDCLALQIWTPGLDARRRPVLVWLHGGGFTSGAGSLPVFDGARLARRGDVVVVNVNYRLGALGFLAHPDRFARGEVAANYGVLDQIAALAWVREHAERIGGDPARVTVFGESAGAMSIGALLAAPAARGLFQRAILQSGAAHNVSPRESALRIATLFRDATGHAEADVAALRALPVEAVLAAQQRVVDESWKHVEGLAFQPTVDGSVVPRAPLDAIGAGAAADVALLIGTNLDEWRLFAIADAKLRDMDEAALLRRLVRVPPGATSDPQQLAGEAVEVYRRARAGALPTDPASLWLAMQTDRVFRVPAIRLAERQLRHASVFQYRFDWPSPALGGLLGACHGLEVPFVFGTLDQERAGDLVGRGPAAQALSERMQDAWIAFATHGDPGWPAYDLERRATQRFAAACDVELDPHSAERRFWDGRI